MHLSEILTPKDLHLGFNPGDKWNGIRILVENLVAAGRLSSERQADVLEDVLEREHSMSTGMEDGIAIPHAAVEGIEEVLATVGFVDADAQLDFDAVDGLPTQVVVLLVIPREQKMLHIRTMAEVARVLGDQELLARLVACGDQDEAYTLLTSATHST
ncbi:MAG: hypothetical protein CMJ86_07995 [Planctomycetes bacterium]|jgi:mannitol/fructose-specific phosphotransferase system IIA component (Ntr-type)|nr:hypothetical protein [Planctomycetota bacterium]